MAGAAMLSRLDAAAFGSVTPVTAAGDHPGRGPVIGRVAELWRYPVKSLGGQRLACATLEARGMTGDRRWAVRGGDGRFGSGKTTRRFRRMPHLLSLTAHTDPDGVVWIAFPDGRCGRADDPQTAAWVGEVTGAGVDLGEDEGAAHFDDAPLHVVTAADLADLQASRGDAAPTDPRRFRPNLVVEAEAGLVPGGRYLVGEAATVATTGATVRCVMTTMAQPGLDFVPGILKHLEERYEGCFGVYATVERPGDIAVGDPVTLLS